MRILAKTKLGQNMAKFEAQRRIAAFGLLLFHKSICAPLNLAILLLKFNLRFLPRLFTIHFLLSSHTFKFIAASFVGDRLKISAIFEIGTEKFQSRSDIL